MNKISRHSTVVMVVLTGFVTPLPTMAVNLVEGEWETQVRLRINGAAFPVPFKTKKCITLEDMIPNSSMNEQCEVTDQDLKGDEVRWSVLCRDEKGELEGFGKVIYQGKTFKGTLKLRVTESDDTEIAKLEYEMTGEHKGICSTELD